MKEIVNISVGIRSVDEILNESMVIKSQAKYEKAWSEFYNYAKFESEPTEETFIRYFDYLKNTRNYASSTMWSIYSMLNHKTQLLFGKKLQTLYPRLTMLLKSFESGYVRKKSNIFTKDEINKFLTSAPDSGEFIHIKAGIVLGFCGGLRCADLISIQNSDFEFNEVSGMWVSYCVSKQRGEEIKNKFNVPLEYCEYLERFDHALHNAGVAEGRIFKAYRCRKDGSGYYTRQVMGIHQLRKFTFKVAEYLKLPNPASYTGHALRRSAANVVAEAGASSTMMKQHFNWKSDTTVNKYVDNTNSGKLVISDMFKNHSPETVSPETSTRSVTLTNCNNVVIHF